MQSKESQQRRTNRPFSFSLGLALSLWLASASGFNATAPDTTPPQLNNPGQDAFKDAPEQFLDHLKLSRQRELFVEAEQALKKRHYDRFYSLADQLRDYPLYSYLQYRDIKRRLSQVSEQEINAFLSENDNTIIGERMRSYLLRHYARSKQWDAFVRTYDGRQSTGLYCKYLRALLNTEQRDEALQQTRKVWLSGRSQPRSCDPLFSDWEQAGQLTEALIWQRIELAMDRGRTRLARHIAKKLPRKQDRELVYLWSQIHRKPQLVLPGSRLNGHPRAALIRLHAVNRMAIKDPDKAIELWSRLRQRYPFSADQVSQANRAIGLRLARRHHPQAMQWLAQVQGRQVDRQVREWRIRSAIRHGLWDQVVNSIEQLPVADQSDLRWQFWWAYANDHLGRVNDAEGIYRYLASKRSYYGFLAADRLNMPYSFENRPLDFDQRELARIATYPEAIRAHELFQIERIIDARREWRQLIGSMSRHERLAAAQLAHSWGWHDRAIVTMGKTDYRDDIALRFPMPMKRTVETYSQRQAIDPAWTYAIIRRESAFMPDVRSSAGALGLMQLMPGTARQVARSMKLRYPGQRNLLRSETNIKLGTGYLGQMLKRLDSQAVLATAAYNAGPHRVEKWLPEQPMDAIRWVETIPFTETREYVSNVLAYTIIYQHVMSRQYTRLAQRMPPVPAREAEPQTADLAPAPGNENS